MRARTTQRAQRVTLEHTVPTTPSDHTDGRFFTDHYLPVMRLCMHHLHDESDAEDAVQEVFRRALQRRAELRGDPLPWLITVARNVCRDELRRRRSALRAAEQAVAMAATEVATPADPQTNPERVVVGHLFVRELLGRLSPAERRVVAARVYQGASGVDAAHALGVSSSTTRVLLARARHKLRQYLEDTQAAFAAAPLIGTRLLHAVRRHLVLRPQTAEASAGLLLPAALMVTVMMSPGAALPAVAGRAPTVALRGGGGSIQDASLAVASDVAGNGALLHRAAPAVAPHAPSGAAAPGGGTPWSYDSVLKPPETDQVSVWDIEPSPDYGNDHTVLMLGTTPLCNPPTCTQLFESTDGGASWTYVGAPGLTGTSLILPTSSFSQGTFYAWGSAGLQMTTNFGKTFVSVVPPVGGFAVAAPAWSRLGVLLSNDALWQVAGGTAPQLLSAFGAGQQAVSVPLVLPDAGGYQVLQAVTASVSLAKQTSILRCTRTCSVATPLPFYSTHTALIPSPTFAGDRTVFAVGFGHWLAISHDGAQSFGAPLSVPMAQMLVVPHDGGRRLVAIIDKPGGSQVLETSDDDGATWQSARIDPSLQLLDAVNMVSELASGRLITSLPRGDKPGLFGFACSADGSYWSACTSTRH